MTRRTREEQETIIRFDATPEDAYLSTFSPVIAKRWERLGVVWTQEGGEWRGRWPKKLVSVRRVRPPHPNRGFPPRKLAPPTAPELT